MKLEQSQSTLIASRGVQETGSFSFAQTGHMFRLLSDGLYANKKSAVIRETACNAVDSHIAAGKPYLPIEVKLPTSLDSSFYVKDWGVGLTHEQVMKLYTTYGWSSKQDNNEETGGFGLGSKSPFAYAGAGGFTVTVARDGVKRTYVAYLAEDGQPRISSMPEGPSDEDWPNGVMVTFPVKPEDFDGFRKEALEVFRWFRVKPRLLGCAAEIPSGPPIRDSFYSFPRAQEWDPVSGGFKAATYNGPTGAAVVMGGVRYPIDSKSIGSLGRLEATLLSFGIHLHLPLGSVLMTPAREGLQYTGATIAALTTHLTRAAKSLAAGLKEAFAGLEAVPAWPRRHLRMQAVARVAGEIGLTGHSRNVLVKFLEYADYSTSDLDAIAEEVTISAARCPAHVGTVDSPVALYLRLTGTDSLRRISIQKGMDAGRTTHNAVSFETCRELVVVYSDAPHAVARARLLALETGAQVLLVKGDKAAANAIASGDLAGVRVLGASEVLLPESKQGAGEAKKRSPFLESLVWVITPANHVVPQQVALGDLVAKGQGFYLQSTNPETFCSVSGADSAGNQVYVRGDSLQVQVVLESLASRLNLDLGQIALVRTTADKQLQALTDAGWKPLLAELQSKLVDAAARNAAGLDLSYSVEPGFDEARSSKYFRWNEEGALGLLRALVRSKSSAFNHLKQVAPESAVVRLGREAARAGSRQSAVTLSDDLLLINRVTYVMPFALKDLPVVPVMSKGLLQGAGEKLMPCLTIALDGLAYSLDQLEESSDANPPVSFESTSACKALMALLSADNLLEERPELTLKSVLGL